MADATSAAFATDLDWEKLDVTAFSWQKGLGQKLHGMLEAPKQSNTTNNTPLLAYTIFPKPKNAQAYLMKPCTKGHTINTLSMLCGLACKL